MLFVFFLLTNSIRRRVSNLMPTIVKADCESKTLRIKGNVVENYLISKANQYLLTDVVIQHLTDKRDLYKPLNQLSDPIQQSYSYFSPWSRDPSYLNIQGYSLFFEALKGNDRVIKFCPFRLSGKKNNLGITRLCNS